jgi:hypothetical protein
MNETELPEHPLEFLVWRALKKSKQIDCISIAEEIFPDGVHPDYWVAAKRLGNYLLSHMAMRRLIWRDDMGWWSEVRK